MDTVGNQRNRGKKESTCVRIHWDKHYENAVQCFKNLLGSQAFTDCIIICSDGQIKCHRAILWGCSTSHQIKEMLQNSDCCLSFQLMDVKLSDMEKLLKYMYTGEMFVSGKEFLRILKVAKLLKVKGLGNLVEEEEDEEEKEEEEEDHDDSAIEFDYNEPPTPPLASSEYDSIVNGSISQDDSSNYSIPSDAFYATPESPPNIVQLEDVCPQVSARDDSDGPPPMKKIKIQNRFLHMPWNRPHFQTPSPSTVPEIINGSEWPESGLKILNVKTLQPVLHLTITSPQETSTEENLLEQRKYKQYTQETLEAAIEAVIGDEMSALSAARKFNVPSRTLYDRIKRLREMEMELDKNQQEELDRNQQEEQPNQLNSETS